jgi:threonine synthase
MSVSVTRAPELPGSHTVFDSAVADAGVCRPRAELADHVDRDYDAETSIVLRYRHAFNFGDAATDRQFKDLLVATSIREGVRIVPLLTYKGVDIWIMDETSLMHTKTLKSIDGCVTTAKCRLAGLDRVVLETGGNTGSALTAYGTRAGIETYCFVPAENLSLLNSEWFTSAQAHLIGVEDPGTVKHAAHLFAQMHGLAHIPQVAWRYEASRFRGMLIVEHCLRGGRFDWIAQSISAAFGPIGIYWSLRQFGRRLGRVPRFLGVQQEANCPMYRAWRSHQRTLRPKKLTSTAGLLSQTMYDVKPHTYGTYRDLLALLEIAKGELLTINHTEFGRLLAADFDGSSIRERLADQGIDIGQEVVEKTGLMALAGTLKLIDAGGVPRGKRILCCLTSGVSAADGRARAEFTVTSLRTALRDYTRRLEQVGARAD